MKILTMKIVNHIDPSPLVVVLLVAHLAALTFGLIGLLIMLPHPELWTGDPHAVRVFDFSMKYAGSIHILFGALTMLAFGVRAFGARTTLIFAAVTYVVSLSSELIGTGTGWPFGNYAYTDFLGWKVLGHVTYTIPMSWFYMGLAAYLIGSLLASSLGRGKSLAWTCLLGAWFLTVWDLVLDPAMAHSSLRVKFWIWKETGAYFEMPIQNLVGWSVTGLIFMILSRALWKRPLDMRQLSITPLVVYVANIVFAMVVSASVGLWLPIIFSAILGLVPAVLVVRARSGTRRSPTAPALSHG
jgi:putative membrane protein